MNCVSNAKFCARAKDLVGRSAVLAVLLITAACSQSVDSVSIEANQPAPANQPFRYFSTTDIQGSTTTAPTSASFITNPPAFGGTYVRTTSASASFMMVGGIAVD